MVAKPRAVRLRRNRLRAPIGTSRLEHPTRRNTVAMHGHQSRRRDMRATTTTLRLRRLPRARSSPRTTAIRITNVSLTMLNRLPGEPIPMQPSRGPTGFPLANPTLSRIFTTKPPWRTSTTRTLRLRAAGWSLWRSRVLPLWR